MKTITINNNRRLSQSSASVGFKDENNIEKIKFVIPEEFKNYNKKVCLKAGNVVFGKLLDNDILTLTSEITQYSELDLSIEFFDNDNNIIARTSKMHLVIEDSIVCEDVSPDEPKVVILNELIEKVNKGIKQVDNIDIDIENTTVTIVKKDGSTKSVDVKGDKGDKGDTGDTGTKLEMTMNEKTYELSVILKDSQDRVISSPKVSLPLESMIIDAYYDSDTQSITMTLHNNQTITFSIADLVHGLVNEDTFNEAVDIFNNNLDMKFDKPYYFEYSNNNGDYESTEEDTLAFFNEMKNLIEDGQRPCIIIRKGVTKANAFQTYHFVVPQLGSSEDAYIILKSSPVRVRNDEFNVVDIKCEIDPQTRQITRVYEKANDGKIKLNLPFTLKETMSEAEKVDIMQAVYINWISGIWTNLTYVDANNQNYCLYDVEKFEDNIDFYIRKGGKASSVNGVGYYSYDRFKIRCSYQDNVILSVDIEELGDSYYLADNGQILGKNNATEFIPEQPYQPATKDYADSKILVVNLTKDEVAGLNADKTLEEIFKAIDNGNVVIAKIENDIVNLTYSDKTNSVVYFSNIFDDNSINISCVEDVWTNTEVQIITDKGGKMAGNLDMDGYSLKNISELHLDGSAPLYLGATVKSSGTLGSRITGTTSGEVAVVKADKQAEYVPILIGEPTSPNHSATKDYVDSRITQSQLSQYPLYYAEVNGTVDNWCNSATLLPILKEAYSGGYKDIMVKTIDNARFMTCHGADLQMLTQTSNANLKFVNLQYLTGSTVNKTRMYYGYAYAEGVQLNSHGEIVITGNCGMLPSGTNYVDLMEKDGLKQISGYDSSKTQVLKNVQGTIKWVDEN